MSTVQLITLGLQIFTIACLCLTVFLLTLAGRNGETTSAERELAATPA